MGVVQSQGESRGSGKPRTCILAPSAWFPGAGGQPCLEPCEERLAPPVALGMAFGGVGVSAALSVLTLNFK